jgi:hypothetical protein
MALLRNLLVTGLMATAIAQASAAGPAAAAEEPLRVETSVDRRTIAIGDTFSLYLDLTWQQGVEVKPLAVTDRIGSFVVRDIREGLVSPTPEGMTRRLSFLLTVFETGTHTVPALSVIYVQGDGTTGRIETRSIDIEVGSVLPEDAAEIRDIKEPIAVQKRWKDLIMSYALLIGLAAGTAVSVLFSVKRRQEIEAMFRRLGRAALYPLRWLLVYLLGLLGLLKGRRAVALRYAVEVMEPDIPPEDAALRELDRIEALGLAERGMIKDFYTLVSETVRRYLERKYDILAMESPTSHTMVAISGLGLPPTGLDLIGEVLEEGDLVKFAKYRPQPEAVGSLLGRGRDIVRRTAGPPPGEPVEASREEAGLR